MKRLHVSLSVSDLSRSRGFYAAMFGAEPTLERDGYVQWMLDDPAVNFVIEDSNAETGLTHLGVQASDEAELAAQFDRVEQTGNPVFDEGDTQCCYARSTKNWVTDPDGIAWETFLTHERTEDFGDSSLASLNKAKAAANPTRAKSAGCSCC